MILLDILRALKSTYIILKWRAKGVYVAFGSFVSDDVRIGKYTRINLKSHLQTCEVGACCAIAGRLIVRDSNHFIGYLNMQDNFQQSILKSKAKVAGYKKGNVVIGNGVWIGDSVILLSGVHIGNGAVIGAGSVVTKSIPDYAIAVGNPAKVIKFRFDQEVINIVSRIDWWNWDKNKLKKNRELFEKDFTGMNAQEALKIVSLIR